MSLAPGMRIGPYEVLATLGAGGMGEVYRARDTRLDRDVAIKVLPDSLAGDRERMARFRREAHLLAVFNHPHIAAVYSFEALDAVQLLVMEMVPGRTVQELLADGPLHLSRALAIARQTADALDAAHGKGILHRDLKPANVKVTPDGKVKLLDFGLGKALESRPETTDGTETPTQDAGNTHQGTVLGTVPYMSPEQVRGQPLDGRSDVWSFGCLLFEMLSGRRAFEGTTSADLLAAILDREPNWGVLPEGTPPWALTLIQECLQKDRDRRIPGMSQISQQLDSVLDGRTIDAPLGPFSTGLRRNGPRVWMTTGLLLAAAVSVAALLLVALHEKRTAALPATKLLAILPATDLTGRADGRQLCEGVSFSLCVKLQSAPGITIMRPSGPALLTETDAAKWARDTGANLLVQPVVRQMGDTRQLSFSIFLAGSPVQLAAGEVSGPAAQHFRLEDELTQKITAALQLHVAKGRTGPSLAPPSVPDGAPQTDYVVALGYLEHYNDKASVEKAISMLTPIPGGESSALVQAALGRGYLASYFFTKEVGFAALAQQAAQRAIALDPDLPETQVTLGQILTATGRSHEAIVVIKKALSRDPNSVTGMIALAGALQQSQDMAGAEQTLVRLVELRPTSWAGFNRLGTLYFLSSRYEKAAEAYGRAIALNPEVAAVHLNLGAVFLRLGRFEEARAALDDSIRIRPVPQAYSNLGVAHYLLGRFPEAATSFQHAVDLAPKNFRWHLYLGDALAQIPEQAARSRAAYATALPLVRSELTVNPNDALSVVLLGRCLARTGEPERAWSEIRRGVALEPEDQEVLETAAAAAMVLGKKVEALVWLKKAVARGYGLVEIQRDPDFAPLRGEPEFEKLALSVPAVPSATPSTQSKGVTR